MPKMTVAIADLNLETLAGAFDAILAPFGGVQAVPPTTGTVHVEPNGIHFAPKCLLTLASWRRFWHTSGIGATFDLTQPTAIYPRRNRR